MADQIGSPTYTKDLAVLLVDMAETDKYGIYHASNEGYCSWYEFTKEIFRQAGMQVEVKPLTSEEYPAKARRPYNSRLDKSKLTENGFHLLPPWQDALEQYLANRTDWTKRFLNDYRIGNNNRELGCVSGHIML